MRIRKILERPAILWAIATLGLVMVFFAITYLGWQQKPHRIQTIMQVMIVGGGAAVYFLRRRAKSVDWVVLCILFAGVVMRVGYALYTSTTLRFHDLAPIDSQATGHAGYVLNLFENGALPPSNDGQFAQPPFYYALAASMMQLYSWITGITNQVELFEAVRIVSCLASLGTLLVCYGISQELQLAKGASRIFLCITAFLPNHYLLAGRANPDALAVFFCFGIVWLALRWYRDASAKNTVWLAICFGLGMMTKMTVAVLALPVGVMMVIRFFERCIGKRDWKFAGTLLLFLCISVPLGLWFPVRNMLLYGQPIVSVVQMALNDPQYLGHLPLIGRYLLFDPATLFSPQYIDWATGTNIILYTAKTSVFGEFSYDIAPLIPQVLLTANMISIALSLYATVRTAIWAFTKRNAIWLFLLLVWVTVFVSYVVFTLQYPFCCSMDYRYMVPTSLIGALVMVKTMALHREDGRGGKAYGLILGVSTVVFSLASIAMYTTVA